MKVGARSNVNAPADTHPQEDHHTYHHLHCVIILTIDTETWAGSPGQYNPPWKHISTPHKHRAAHDHSQPHQIQPQAATTPTTPTPLLTPQQQPQVPLNMLVLLLDGQTKT